MPASEVRGIDLPRDVQVNKDGIAGKMTVPQVSLDGRPMKIEVEFKGSRVGNFLSGTYKATMRVGGEVQGDARELFRWRCGPRSRCPATRSRRAGLVRASQGLEGSPIR